MKSLYEMEKRGKERYIIFKLMSRLETKSGLQEGNGELVV